VIYVLSPHIDDAIFSLGGMLAKMQNVRVINIFSRSNYTITGLGDPNQITPMRKLEELEVCTAIGMRSTFLDVPERNLRDNQDIEAEWDAIKGIRKEICTDGDLTIYAPLAFGCSHIDHIITKRVAEKLEEIYGAHRFVWYEDLPYVCSVDPQKETQYLAETMCDRLHVIDIHAKMELVNMYKSQVDKNISKLLTVYAYEKEENRYIERTWTKYK